MNDTNATTSTLPLAMATVQAPVFLMQQLANISLPPGPLHPNLPSNRSIYDGQKDLSKS